MRIKAIIKRGAHQVFKWVGMWEYFCNGFSHPSSPRVTTRSMTLRDRGDELGADSVKYRDAIVQVLQKSQQFMEIGEY